MMSAVSVWESLKEKKKSIVELVKFLIAYVIDKFEFSLSVCCFGLESI